MVGRRRAGGTGVREAAGLRSGGEGVRACVVRGRGSEGVCGEGARA